MMLTEQVFTSVVLKWGFPLFNPQRLGLARDEPGPCHYSPIDKNTQEGPGPEVRAGCQGVSESQALRLIFLTQADCNHLPLMWESTIVLAKDWLLSSPVSLLERLCDQHNRKHLTWDVCPVATTLLNSPASSLACDTHIGSGVCRS